MVKPAIQAAVWLRRFQLYELTLSPRGRRGPSFAPLPVSAHGGQSGESFNLEPGAVQASIAANTYVVSGPSQVQSASQSFPLIRI